MEISRHEELSLGPRRPTSHSVRGRAQTRMGRIGHISLGFRGPPTNSRLQTRTLTKSPLCVLKINFNCRLYFPYVDSQHGGLRCRHYHGSFLVIVLFIVLLFTLAVLCEGAVGDAALGILKEPIIGTADALELLRPSLSAGGSSPARHL
eukprot:1193753-Prorocentrum_minimum.AAC.1